LLGQNDPKLYSAVDKYDQTILIKAALDGEGSIARRLLSGKEGIKIDH